MALYYVSTKPQANGDHDVHKSACILMPANEDTQYVGTFDNCFDAVRKAKQFFPKANGCYICSNECYTERK